MSTARIRSLGPWQRLSGAAVESLGRGFVLVYQHLAPFTPLAWPCTVARQSLEAARRPVRPVTLPPRSLEQLWKGDRISCHG
jgi:hypothetical protein